MNAITINFVECDPMPPMGYKLLWRVLGSGDPYTDGGNFFSSPIVFYDSSNPDGTQYEGTVQSQYHNQTCTQVAWSTQVESGGESGESPGSDNSSCGTTISQDTADTTYVNLGFFPLHVDLASHVDLAWDVLSRPNRFTVYDNGSFLITSGWQGIAPYGGPWGVSLSTPVSGSMGFSVIAGHEYKVLIEVGPGGPPPYNVSDSFDLQVICT